MPRHNGSECTPGGQFGFVHADPDEYNPCSATQARSGTTGCYLKWVGLTQLASTACVAIGPTHSDGRFLSRHAGDGNTQT